MVNVLVKTKDGETLFNMDRGGRVDLEKWAGGWRVGSEHPTGTGGEFYSQTKICSPHNCKSLFDKIVENTDQVLRFPCG